MLTLFVCALGFAMIPALSYCALIHQRPAAWRPVVSRVECNDVVGSGPFRRGEAHSAGQRVSYGAMPTGLQIAATSCVVVGQMVIPGIGAAVIGFLVLTEGHATSLALPILLASSLPGSIVALGWWSVGLCLFEGTLPATRSRMSWLLPATWAMNLTLLAAAAIGLGNHWQDADFFYATLAYAPLSLVHSVFVAWMIARHRNAFAVGTAEGSPVPEVPSALPTA